MIFGHRLGWIAVLGAVCLLAVGRAQEPAEAPEIGPAGGATAVAEKSDLDPATFNGAKPGVTTREDLLAAWGKPQEMVEADGSIKHVFSVEPFTHIEVSYKDDKVASILVRLEQRLPAEELAKQLGLDNLSPVLVPDDLGQLLGEAFPERGVLFSYAADSQGREVSLVILEPLAAHSFLLRAETTWRLDYTGALRDVDFALSLSPNDARAHWLKSEILAAVGEIDDALKAVDKAVALASNEPEFRLTRARLWRQTGKHDEAQVELKEAMECCSERPELAARARLQLGDQWTAGAKRDFGKAMEQHLRAIEQAQALADDPKAAVRRSAKEVLLDAHLAVARDVAWGQWKNKTEAVSSWIDKARVLADDLVAHEEGCPELKLRVARQAVASCVGAQGEMDPSAWLEEAVEAAKPLMTSGCPMAQKRAAWDLGMAWYDALQCFQMRGDKEGAHEAGEHAVELLERGFPQMQHAPGMTYQMGRLYFRLGALAANQDQDHESALTWYEKALPLMEKSNDASAADAQRQGEALVSMGVSYWETGHKDEAIRVTAAGAKLIERAVKDNRANPEALKTPYANLAQMHRSLGQESSAKHYETLATRPGAAGSNKK